MEKVSYILVSSTGREVMGFEKLERARERKQPFQRIKKRTIREEIIE